MPITIPSDPAQSIGLWQRIVLQLNQVIMFFSKSFGYAVRALLFIYTMQGKNNYVPLDEIAPMLNLPRQFLARILKNLVKAGLLSSVKGPMGGFRISDSALETTLADILSITDGNVLSDCVIRNSTCSSDNPCPLHWQFETPRQQIIAILNDTRIRDIPGNRNDQFIKSLVEYNTKNELRITKSEE